MVFFRNFYRNYLLTTLNTEILQEWYSEELKSTKVEIREEKEFHPSFSVEGFKGRATRIPKLFEVSFSPQEFNVLQFDGKHLCCYAKIDNFVWRDTTILRLNLHFISMQGSHITLDSNLHNLIKAKIAWILCQNLDRNAKFGQISYAKALRAKFSKTD